MPRLRPSRAKRIIFGRGTATDLKALFVSTMVEVSRRNCGDGIIGTYDAYLLADSRIEDKIAAKAVDVETAFDIACCLSKISMTPNETWNLNVSIVTEVLRPAGIMVVIEPVLRSDTQKVEMTRALLAHAWGLAAAIEMAKPVGESELAVMKIEAEQNFRSLDEELT